MNLFSFFKKTEKKGTDSTVGSDDFLNISDDASDSDSIETTLSFHPEWNVPQEQEYVFSFLANELEPLQANQLSLSGIDIDIEEANGSWLVKSFFRSSLNQEITVGEVELLLLDENNETIASKQFDLNELGTIPPKSARPWIFVFEKETLSIDTPPSENWTLAFNIQSMMPHRLELDSAWEEELGEEQKQALANIVEDLPKLKPKEVNFTGFQARVEDNGNLSASIFIRNGHSEQVNLEQLPLEIIDATGEIVAKGSFELQPLSISANTTKPWTFIFPQELVLKENPDFTRWSARVPQ